MRGMIGLRLTFTLVILVLLVNLQAWADEPTAFREIPFGATQDDIRAKYPAIQCRPSRDDLHCFMDGLTIGDAPVQVAFTLIGEPRQLASVLINFPSKDYDLIKAAFVAKYGEPLGRNEAGLTWEGERWEAFLMRHRKPKPEQGMAAIATKEFRTLMGKRQQEQTRKQEQERQERLERARKGGL